MLAGRAKNRGVNKKASLWFPSCWGMRPAASSRYASAERDDRRSLDFVVCLIIILVYCKKDIFWDTKIPNQSAGGVFVWSMPLRWWTCVYFILQEEKRRMKEEIEKRRAEAAEKRQKVEDSVDGETRKPFKCVSPRGSSLKVSRRPLSLSIHSCQSPNSVSWLIGTRCPHEKAIICHIL